MIFRISGDTFREEKTLEVVSVEFLQRLKATPIKSVSRTKKVFFFIYVNKNMCKQFKLMLIPL